MDGLTAAYFIAFVAGAGFAVLSFVLGSLGGDGQSDGGGDGGDGGDADAGHALDAHAEVDALPAPDGHVGDAGAHGHAAPAGHGIGLAAIFAPLLNLTALAAVACVGGGVGYLARRMGAGAFVSLLASLPSGLAAGYAVGALQRWLRRESRYLKPESLAGTLASVVAPTSDTRLGEVLYVSEGRRRSLPARSTGSRVLGPGAEVVILDYKDGIARVAPADELLGTEPVVPAVAADPSRDARRLPSPTRTEEK